MEGDLLTAVEGIISRISKFLLPTFTGAEMNRW